MTNKKKYRYFVSLGYSIFAAKKKIVEKIIKKNLSRTDLEILDLERLIE